MMTARRINRGQHAFSLVELAMIAAVLAVLAVIVISMVSVTRHRAPRVACLINLKQVGLAFRLYATDWTGRFPQVSTNDLSLGANWETELVGRCRLLSNELSSPKLLVCPGDRRIAAKDFSVLTRTNLSYLLNPDGRAETPTEVLAGDANLTLDGRPVAPGLRTFATNTALGWTTNRHSYGGNLAFSDGSVSSYAAGLRPPNEVIRSSSGSTNRWLVP